MVEVHIIHIVHGIIIDTVQYMGDFRIWQSNTVVNNTETNFQYHFIKSQEDLHKHQHVSHQGGYLGGQKNGQYIIIFCQTRGQVHREKYHQVQLQSYQPGVTVL